MESRTQQKNTKRRKQAKRDFGSTVLRSTCHGNRDESKKLEQEGSIHILLDRRGSKERTGEEKKKGLAFLPPTRNGNKRRLKESDQQEERHG